MHTRRRFSFRLRMKRPAQPFPSGERTKAGELVMPGKRRSFGKSSDMHWLPWSCRSARPRAMSLAHAPK